MITELKISRNDIVLVQGELETNKPYEACGILIGTTSDNTAYVEKTLPVTSVKCARTSFELDPEEFENALIDIDKEGKELVGIYHTHPVTTAVPSQWDREAMINIPLIWGINAVWLIAGADGMRAYLWDDGIKPVEIFEF